MFKLKKSFFILIIFLALVILGISTYLLASGVRVKYDVSQKHYALDASKNEFVKSLLLKYSKSLLVTDEIVVNEKQLSPFGKINEEISKSNDTNLVSASSPYSMSPDVVEKSDEGISSILGFLEDIRTQARPETSTLSWDYKTSFIWGYILNKDVSGGTLTLWITTPENRLFSKTEKEVKVNCISNTSAVVAAENMKVTEKNTSVLEKARPGKDSIAAFCLDANCDLIGRTCVIIQGAGVSVSTN